MSVGKPDLNIKDEQNLSSFNHSANLAERDYVDDYLLDKKEQFEILEEEKVDRKLSE